MKVGTDGVLLGAWTECPGSGYILDIGCGSGLIALMLAQRSKATIQAIDIDEGAYRQAAFNFEHSPFSNRLSVFHSAIQDFQTSQRFDLIISNPPFFSKSLKSPDNQRTAARHNDSLSLEELFFFARKLLTPQGRFCLIIPAKQSTITDSTANTFGFYPIRKTWVLPTPGSQAKRTLLEYALEQKAFSENQITIEIARHHYSDEFIQLTKEYYLKH